jgi:acyl carrier protein
VETLPYLTELISQIAHIPASDITPDSTPRLLAVDSLSLVEIAVSAESDLGIRVDDGELLPDHTVTEMVAILDAKRASAAVAD